MAFLCSAPPVPAWAEIVIEGALGYGCQAPGRPGHPSLTIITTGAFQALYLIARLLLTKDDKVVVEDPANCNITKIFSSVGTQICPVAVDSFGLRTELIPAIQAPRLIYVTPSHQFPLGSVLPVQRRIALVNLVKSMESFIVEDNYDNEFRFEGTPVSSIQGLDPEKVIYEIEDGIKRMKTVI